MSKDKYPNIFSPQMATIVFIILQIFYATRAVLKIGEYSRSFSWGIFGHADSGPPRMNTVASRDQFKPIRIGEHLVVNYNDR